MPSQIHWGLCCLFKEAPIAYRTTTATALAKKENRFAFVSDLIKDNLSALEASISFCASHNIQSFRINSQLLPCYTHPEVGYTLQELPESRMLLQAFDRCKKLAQEKKIRLTFHPDQFVVLNSPTEATLIKSIQEIEYHTMMAELVGADVINIHAGGVYGDKKSALLRFEHNFIRLSKAAQQRLTIENDDRSYSPQDLLPLCKALQIPLVYDVHHHRCLPDNMSIEEATYAALATWTREPLFHLSSPRDGWSGKDTRPHHDYIDKADFPPLWHTLGPITIEVEAKAKELAIFRLQAEN